MVDWTQFKETKVGEKTKTSVIEIHEGIEEDFRSPNFWEKIDATKDEIERLKKTAAIEILTANGARMVIRLPADDKIRPNSNIALWKKTYGDYPEEGQDVYTKTDENGFERVVLEK